MERVAPFISNGGVTGRRSIDDVRALDEIMKFDAKHGGHIAASIVTATASEEERKHRLTESEVMDAFFVVIRRFYKVEKHRVVDYNTKRVMGLSLAA